MCEKSELISYYIWMNFVRGVLWKLNRCNFVYFSAEIFDVVIITVVKIILHWNVFYVLYNNFYRNFEMMEYTLFIQENVNEDIYMKFLYVFPGSID